jgi:D-3-phosphoglycerate dehydrogenase
MTYLDGASRPPAQARQRAVVVTSRSFGSGSRDVEAELREASVTVLRCGPGHDLAELREPLSHAVAWIAGTGPINRAHLELAPGLMVIARYGVGVDGIDIDAANERGVLVTNTPGANADSVADYALALLLAATRHIVDGDRAARAGDFSARQGREISALTIGIIGFGRIGRALAARLVGGFGARVLVHDPYVGDDAIVASQCTPRSLRELVEEVDAISLHLPGGGAPLVDGELLSHVRRGAILINTARADLLDEAAVAVALENGTLVAVAADVLSGEHGAASPLMQAPNVLATPHLAAQTVQSVDRMGSMATSEVLRVLRGESPIHRVPGLEPAAPLQEKQ